MRNKVTAASAAAWLVGGATFAISGQAFAADCPTTANTVFVSGSSAFKNVLVTVGAVLAVLGAA